MASSRGRLPYPLQQESKINTSWYHKEDNSGKPICGSNTHALAQIIQTLIQNKQFDEAIAQINKCKDARELERDKRTNPDPAHDKYIVSLRHFREKIKELKDKNTMATNSSGLLSFNASELIVRYIESTKTFIVSINEQILGGKKQNRMKKYTHKKRKKNIKKKSREKKKKMNNSIFDAAKIHPASLILHH